MVVSLTGQGLVAAVLAGAGSAGPDAPAIVAGRRTLTHRELRGTVLATAAGLTAAGLRPGDAVLFSVRPGPAAVQLALATVAAGGTVVIADPGAGPELFTARAAVARPSWVMAESVLYALARAARASAVTRRAALRRNMLLPDSGRLPYRRVRVGRWLPGVPRGALSVDGLVASGRRSPVHRPVDGPPDPDAPALLVFTSGTTADPKAVVHTDRTLGAALPLADGLFPAGPGDRVVTDLLMIGLVAIARGACWQLPRYGATPGEFGAVLAASGATHAFATPVVWDGVLAAGSLPASLRYVLTGAAPVPAGLLGRLAAAAPPAATVLGIYGGTEMLPSAAVTAAEKTAFSGAGDLIGRPLPGVTARVDPVTRELLLRGPHLCAGLVDGGGLAPLTELATGDAARIEPDGRLVLAGRLKEMIIRGSFNVYPGLYEPLVAALPGVAECALVGVPDPVTADETIVLALVPESGDCADTGLATRIGAALPGLLDSGALPDRIELVTALPRSGRSGKIDRATLVTLLESGRSSNNDRRL